MMVILILALVIVVGVVVAVIVGRVGSDAMAGPNRTSSFELPDGELGARGVESLRFDQALRGYNMAQVDAVLDRLHAELRAFESERDIETPVNRGVRPVPAPHPAEGGARSQPEPARDAEAHTSDLPNSEGASASIVPFRTRRNRDNDVDDR